MADTVAREMLTTLKEATEVKFAEVDSKFKVVEDKVGEVEAKLGELKDGSDAITNQVIGLGADVADMKSELAREVGGVAERLTGYSNQLAVEQARITNLQDSMTKELQVTFRQKDQQIKNLEESVKMLQKKINEARSQGGAGGGFGEANSRKSWKEFFDPAKMTVTALSDQAGWKKWKTDIEDLLECSVKGMADALEESRMATEVVEEEILTEDGMWERRDRLYRFLRRNSEGDARKIVEGVRDNNGWESWRQLNLQFELGMANQKAQARAALAAYMGKKATTVLSPAAKRL